MVTPGTLVVVGGVAVVATAVTVRRQGRPGPKRQHLFETEDGERSNPFSDLSEGARDGTESSDCRGCGTHLDSESFRYCVSCGTRSVADD